MAQHHVTITILKLQDLFVDSIDDNPLISEWEADAGIQRVANYLLIRPLSSNLRVTVRIPDTLEMPASTLERAHAAIERYCDARISENQRERHFTIQTGLIGFAYGFAFWVVMSAILNWFLTQFGPPTWLTDTLDLLYILIAWAILWEPLAAIFFSWLPNYLAIRVYRVIKRAEFVFEPAKMIDADMRF
ncbi:MAG TPA: hypothetical protein VER79_02450 [Candidatus Limnocylindrales bacterium]|nr:hypothetical protein [Candidatus Limnocylindrales bacterium]